MQRASCCCSGSRSGCCCWAICMLHAKCLSIEFVWLSVATSCGSTLTFFCCLSICLVVVAVFVWFFFVSIIQAIAINIICDLRCLFMLLFALLFLSTICWLRGELGTWGSGRHLHVEVGEADILVRPVRAKDTSVHLYMHMHNLC